jgi:hypothetical protein
MPPQDELKVVIIRYMKKYNLNHQEAVIKIQKELLQIMANVDDHGTMDDNPLHYLLH